MERRSAVQKWIGLWVDRARVGVTLVVLCVVLGAHPAFAGDIVKIAKSQLGQGEQGGNNKGPVVEKYTQGQDEAWCAGFVSWVRFQAGARDHYLLAARSYWKVFHRQRVAQPQAGDLIVFSRGDHQGHIGIVEKVQGQTITTIEGNVGPYPAVVKRIHYRLGSIPHLLGFLRV